MTQVSHRLEVAWRARQIHPWARGCEPEEQGRRFAEHSIADTDEALSRLSRELPQIDVIDFKVIHRDPCCTGLCSGIQGRLCTGTFDNRESRRTVFQYQYGSFRDVRL